MEDMDFSRYVRTTEVAKRFVSEHMQYLTSTTAKDLHLFVRMPTHLDHSIILTNDVPSLTLRS